MRSRSSSIPISCHRTWLPSLVPTHRIAEKTGMAIIPLPTSAPSLCLSSRPPRRRAARTLACLLRIRCQWHLSAGLMNLSRKRTHYKSMSRPDQFYAGMFSPAETSTGNWCPRLIFFTPPVCNRSWAGMSSSAKHSLERGFDRCMQCPVLL